MGFGEKLSGTCGVFASFGQGKPRANPGLFWRSEITGEQESSQRERERFLLNALSEFTSIQFKGV